MPSKNERGPRRFMNLLFEQFAPSLNVITAVYLEFLSYVPARPYFTIRPGQWTSFQMKSAQFSCLIHQFLINDETSWIKSNTHRVFSSLASPKHSGDKQRNTRYNRSDGVIEVISVIHREGSSVATETCWPGVGIHLCFLGHKQRWNLSMPSVPAAV